MNVRDQTRWRFVTSFRPIFVTGRASLFTDHKIWGLPKRARYTHFRTICEQTVDKIHQQIHCHLLKMLVIQAWRCDFMQLSRFIRKFAISFPRISSHDFPRHQQKFWIQTYFCNYSQYPCLFDILFDCNPNTHGQRTMLALPNQRLSVVFFKWDWCSVSCQPVLHRPRIQTRIVLFSVNEQTFPV